MTLDGGVAVGLGGLGAALILGSRGVGGATEDQRRSRASAKLTVSSRKS